MGNDKSKVELNLVNWLIVFIFFFIQNGFSQTKELDDLMANGEKAFSENNFSLAKEIFTKVTNLIPNDKNGWYNLGASELGLGDNENACEHFYQAYLRGDGEALELIKTNCPNFRNGSIMSLNDVEEKPKFIYDGKEYLLFEKNGINPKYVNFVVRELKRSRIIYEKAVGRNTYVHFAITNADSLNIKIANVTGDQKDAEIIKQEVISIFNKSFTYISAKNKGVSVELWEKWSIPIRF